MATKIEVIRRIWDDKEGVCLEVRTYQDGLYLVELHTPDDTSKEYFGAVRVLMNKDIARQIGDALIAASNED